MTKICIKCGEEKDIELFVKGENKCRSCVAIYMREYRQKNADKRRESDREYRQKNADKIREYLQKNADKIHKREHEYRQKNADKLNKRNRQWYQKNTFYCLANAFFNRNGLSIKNVPKELIELKTLQLELMRETRKQRENEK